MRHDPEKTGRYLVSGMFHRRVLLLGGMASGIVLAMVLQLAHLTVVEGSEFRAAAETRLDRRTILPTYRGRILDRWGLVLAEDRAGYDLAVRYDVITGSWELEQATIAAARSVGSDAWNDLSEAERISLTNRHLPEHSARAASLWNRIAILGQIDEAELMRRRDDIRTEVHRMAAHVREKQRRARIKELGLPADAEIPGDAIAEEKGYHVILTDVTDDTAFTFRRLAEDHQDLIQIIDAQQRVYPWTSQRVTLDRSSLPKPIRRDDPIDIEVTGVLDHVLGSMRAQTTRQDLDRRPFWTDGRSGGEIADLGGYQQVGDHVGSRGLELVYEDHLRGTRGVEFTRKDSDQVERVEPVAGADLQLTIDVDLQARIQAILHPEFGLTRVQPWHRNDERLRPGTPLNAAATVIDVETGEVLAMVSMPTMKMGSDMTPLLREINAPFVNRAVEGVYPPGSIIKPLILCAAVGSGAHGIHNPVTCTGHYYPHVTSYARCWIYRQEFDFQNHGELHAAEALARSCNIYFYTLADDTGMHNLTEWLRAFGLGNRLDVGLKHEMTTADGDTIMLGEQDGDLPTEQMMAKWTQDFELQAREIAMGIGQGPITWTPLHASNAYAVLARGGEWRQPTIVHDDPYAGRRTMREPVAVDDVTVREVLKGLRMSVTETFGSGNHLSYGDAPNLEMEPIFNAAGVKVWGKTGTAEAPALPYDGNRNGRIDRNDRNVPLEHDRMAGLSHAWFVGLVGPEGSEQPTHAISVIVEYGGSGGRVAGPVANQIIRALQQEGYLPAES